MGWGEHLAAQGLDLMAIGEEVTFITNILAIMYLCSLFQGVQTNHLILTSAKIPFLDAQVCKVRGPLAISWSEALEASTFALEKNPRIYTFNSCPCFWGILRVQYL